VDSLPDCTGALRRGDLVDGASTAGRDDCGAGEDRASSGPGPAVLDRVIRSDSDALDCGSCLAGLSRPRDKELIAIRPMPRTQSSTGRERAVGTHFPMLAADIAAAAVVARQAARFEPDFTRAFRSDRDSELRSHEIELRSETATGTGRDPGTPTLTHGSGRPTRSAGLGSGMTRTRSAMDPGCLVKRPGWHCCRENEPGMDGMLYPTGIMGNTSYHTIPSRKTS
jgi:hypothetical protein